MREIKFRVFDEKEGVYFNGWDGSEITITFYQEENEKGEIGYIQYKELGCNCNPDDACGGCVDIWQCEPLTNDSIIEQYIGHKDRNGSESYAGDLCEYGYEIYSDNHCRIEFDLLHIKWCDSHKRYAFFDALNGDFYCNLSDLKPQEFEIIGNIHENPELLEVS